MADPKREGGRTQRKKRASRIGSDEVLWRYLELAEIVRASSLSLEDFPNDCDRLTNEVHGEAWRRQNEDLLSSLEELFPVLVDARNRLVERDKSRKAAVKSSGYEAFKRMRERHIEKFKGDLESEKSNNRDTENKHGAPEISLDSFKNNFNTSTAQLNSLIESSLPTAHGSLDVGTALQLLNCLRDQVRSFLAMGILCPELHEEAKTRQRVFLIKQMKAVLKQLEGLQTTTNQGYDEKRSIASLLNSMKTPLQIEFVVAKGEFRGEKCLLAPQKQAGKESGVWRLNASDKSNLGLSDGFPSLTLREKR